MTENTESVHSQRIEQEQERHVIFLSAIQGLYEDDRGKIASLKRNAGNTLSEARGLAWFEYYLLRHMPSEYRRHDNLCLLVASLMTFDRKTMLYGIKREKGDFGASLGSLRTQEERKSARPAQTPLERRLVILLDATFDDDGGGEMAFRLRQAVKFALAKSRDVPIDWPRLLKDVLDWGRPNKLVQKRWARSFYAVPDEPELSSDNETAAPLP